LAVAFGPAASQAGVLVSITIAPPILPVYVQPVIPGDGYLWTPGYWGYGDEGYFWVPGVWVQPPTVGVLWTPGYWGWNNGLYAWNAGYWGPSVGFYGGVNYGFGFGGVGFEGGRWDGGHFSYNTAVVNVGGVSLHNSYRTAVAENNVHTSFNGGTGGIRATPSAAERTAMSEHHTPATSEQTAHHTAASHDRSQLASVNHGKPANAAMSRPAAASHAANHSTPAANHSAPVANHAAPAEHRAAPVANHAAPAEHRAAPVANHAAPAANHPAAPANHAAPAASHPAPAASHAAPASKPAAAKPASKPAPEKK